MLLIGAYNYLGFDLFHKDYHVTLCKSLQQSPLNERDAELALERPHIVCVASYAAKLGPDEMEFKNSKNVH